MHQDINKYWRAYAQEYSFEEYLSNYRYKKLFEIMNKNSHKKILDIGGGMNPLFNILENYESYTMIEPGDEAFLKANEKKQNDGRVNIIKGYFEEVAVDIKDRSYDFIFSIGVLHETSTPVEFLKNIEKLCNSETVVFLNVPNAESFHRILAMEAGLIDKLDEFTERNLLLGQQTIFTMNSLLDLISDSLENSVIIEKGTFFVKPFTHDQMMKLISCNIINNDIIEGFYNMSNWVPNVGSEMYVTFKNKKQ